MFRKAIFLSPTNAQCRKRSPCAVLAISDKTWNMVFHVTTARIVKMLTQSVRDFPRVQLGRVREPFHERLGLELLLQRVWKTENSMHYTLLMHLYIQLLFSARVLQQQSFRDLVLVKHRRVKYLVISISNRILGTVLGCC